MGPAGVATAFADAWNRHDMEAFAALFREDASFVNVVGLWWRSRAEIKAAHEATHATMFRNSQLSGTVSSVQDVGPAGVKSVHFTWELTGIEAPGGGIVPARQGILLLVVVEEDGDWRIAVAQNTDIVPGALAPPASNGGS